MNYGGLDLSLKDKKGFDVFYLSINYKRINQIKVLNELKKHGVNLLDINLK
jgi:hypothetical protein